MFKSSERSYKIITLHLQVAGMRAAYGEDEAQLISILCEQLEAACQETEPERVKVVLFRATALLITSRSEFLRV